MLLNVHYMQWAQVSRFQSGKGITSLALLDHFVFGLAKFNPKTKRKGGLPTPDYAY